MGTNPLRQLLISLCDNSHWKYAVFWKLKHQNPLILTWEDGYCDNAKPAQIAKGEPDDIYAKGAKVKSFSGCKTSMPDNGSGGCPIGLAVANLSSLQYALGEG
ncbi:MYC/MYB transcription factor [Parasponia andersonii]|uniref:MYC/MYB transcription factor n=1 Tax=Parasponia andersonii TaxID=3476 RepID=A0A2P5A905_PARAD|nr:MYC/MYB transcription factor [Parasponia andersonii]